ncbi:MAG: phosphonopyruvate decarboxylase [Fibromonadaceae bacterium]|jgi:phosphonopyruvate decarboxylase|nr:phosphonopyruvate decarboxylase [Fibromonadaceae bacterium]
MKAELLAQHIKQLGIEVLTGVPDSTLKEFCDYINSEQTGLVHYTVPNEGSAVGIAAGTYLSTGKPACIYMQNSGIGNTVNPVTSIANAEVYSIPIFFIVGYRGAPGTKDEPQHKFMGRITEKIFDCLEIEYEVIDKNTSETELNGVFGKIKNALENKKQFALIIKKDTFDKRVNADYSNGSELNREHVISELIKKTDSSDLIVSTTGKISREVYEQSDLVLNNHKQCFLTVGGMGHASMIAFGIAKKSPSKRVICMDGDGAALMHLGNMAFIGKQNTQNLIHICLNNEAHESVGGMPTAAPDFKYAQAAKVCGYPSVFEIKTASEFSSLIEKFKNLKGLTFIEIKVANTSRDDLVRPKETALENAVGFMDCVFKA